MRENILARPKNERIDIVTSVEFLGATVRSTNGREIQVYYEFSEGTFEAFHNYLLAL